MKKIYLLSISLFLFMFSCNQDDLTIIENEPESEKILKDAGDGKYDLLGFSYDVTKEYLHVDAAPRRVIDIEAFARDHSGRVYKQGSTLGNTEYYAGATSVYMLEDMKSKTKIGTGDLPNLSGVDFFSASVKYEREFDKKYEFSTKYSFARGDVIKRKRKLYLNSYLEQLSNYIHQDFYDDLERLTPAKFVEEYGTHVLTDITIGGRLSFVYRSVITSENTTTRKKDIIDAGLKFSIGMFGADSQNHHEKEVTKTLNKKNDSWKVWVEYHGGEQSGLSFEYDSQEGHKKTNFNQSNWENSVNETNAALVEINWDRAYPIFEFISDPVKKQQIKTAVENYIKSKKLEILSIVPFYQWHNPSEKNTAYTMDPNHHFGNGWVRHGIVCYVEGEKTSENTGLIQWHNPREKNTAYTIDPNHHFGSGWDKHGIACYVPIKSSRVTYGLIQWHNPKEKNTAYTIDPTHHFGNGWERHGIACYVYSAE